MAATFIGLHPDDMTRLDLTEDTLVTITSRRGQLVIPARADDAMQVGQVFLPMHWGSAFVSGAGINALTLPVTDPLSHQPELKHCAVRVERAALPWALKAWVKGDATILRAALTPWLQRFAFAAILPVAIGGGGVRVWLSASEPPAPLQLDAPLSMNWD